MEIIQTIYNALTTENETLSNIITSPLIILEAIVMMLLFTEILKIKSNKKQKIIYVLSISIFSLISRYFIPNPYGTILNLIFSLFCIKLIFKTSFLNSILAIILPMLIVAFTEYLITNTYFKLLNISLEKAQLIPIHRFTIMPIIYLAIYFIYLLIKKFKVGISILESITTKNKIILITCLLLATIIIIIQTILTTNYNNDLPVIITLFGILSLISYFIAIISILNITNKLELTKIDLEETKLYNKTLSILHDNIRSFKHDFNNIVQAIGGYVNTNDINGLKKFYSELQEDCQKSNNLSALNPDTINNPAIYSLLASKYHKADELGIKVNLEIFLDLNKLNMKIYEFTRILGILLDNAIEATSECSEKVINVFIRKDFNLHRQLLIIENTYKHKNIDTEKIFEKGFSTKDKNTGLGLWEIRQILNKNSNLNLFTSKDDILFKQQLEIY